MKTKLWVLAFLSVWAVSALAEDRVLNETLVAEISGGSSFISSSELNALRNAFLWYSTTPSGGSFNNFQYLAGSVGFHKTLFLQC